MPFARAGRAMEVQPQWPALFPGAGCQSLQRPYGPRFQRQLLHSVQREDQLAEGSQPRIQAILVQQETYDLLVQLESVGQQGRVVAIGLWRKVNQPLLDDGRIRIKVNPLLQPGGCIGAEQTQGQVHARPAAADVILEVGVQPLVAEVELGRQGN